MIDAINRFNTAETNFTDMLTEFIDEIQKSVYGIRNVNDPAFKATMEKLSEMAKIWDYPNVKEIIPMPNPRIPGRGKGNR